MKEDLSLTLKAAGGLESEYKQAQPESRVSLSLSLTTAEIEN